jgi:hypothetical protein
MSETPALGELRADFTERNTALFMFLGLLSSLGGIQRLLEAEATRPAAPAAAGGPPAKLDYLVLGLVALHRQVTAFAERGRRDVQTPDPPRPTPPPADLLR